MRAFVSLCLVVGGVCSWTRAGAATPESAPYAWRNVVITGGGFVSGIIPHPTEPGLRYARTDVGGAYRWDEAGRRWTPITEWIAAKDWTLTGVESLALDPTDPERVYLAAGCYTNDWSGNGAILRSADRGATWRRTPMPFKFGGNEPGRSNGERLAVDPRAPENLWLGTRRDGLWRSADRGETWARVAGFTTPDDTIFERDWPVGVVAVIFPPRAAEDVSGEGPSREIWLAVSSPSAPLWRSVDGGESWAPVEGQPLGLRPHQAKFGAGGALYVTYGDQAGPNGVTDGAVWKRASADGRWTEITPLKPGEGDRFGYSGLALDARRPGVLVASSICRWAKHDEIWRSVDDGLTWTALGPSSRRETAGVEFLRWGREAAPDLGHWIGDVEIDPFDSDRAWYVTGMTVWGTENLADADAGRGTDWAVRAQGIEETVISDLAAPPAGAPLLSAMWDIDGFRHERLDRSPARGFYQPNHTRSTGIDFAENDPCLVVRVHGGGGSWSEDNGRTWKKFAATPAGPDRDGRVAVSADGASWVWTPERGAPHASIDRGASWRKCAGLPEGAQVVSDRAQAGRFYAADPSDGRVFASIDGGASFRERGVADARDGQLRAAPGRVAHLWWASPRGLFRSRDAGLGWERVAAVTSGARVAFGRAAKADGYPTVFLVGEIGGVYGVFRSVDEGASWTRINTDERQFHHINALAGDPRVFGRVFIGTGGRGIYYGEPAEAR